MLYRLWILVTYTASAIVYQPSCFFPWFSIYHLLQNCHDCCCFPRVKIMGQPYMTFLLLFSIQFTLLLFSSILIYPLLLHSFFQFLLQFFPCWFPSFLNQLSIYLDVALFKLNLYFNIAHCLHCFLYYGLLLLDVLSSPCSFDPLVFQAGQITSDSQPRFFVNVPQWFYSSSTIFSYQVQSLIAWLFP